MERGSQHLEIDPSRTWAGHRIHGGTRGGALERRSSRSTAGSERSILNPITVVVK